MNIAVLFKVVPDDQDVQILSDRSLDFSKAKPVVSEYDLNAIEAAARIAEANEGSRLIAITVADTGADDSKLKKNVCSRGVDEIVMLADARCASLDAHATARLLASLVEESGPFDLLVCGDGSADNYSQQVDVQTAAALGWPAVNAAISIEVGDGEVEVERLLEDEVETVRVALPAVVAVSPDIATPRIPGMKDILAAGKKNVSVSQASDVCEASLEVVSCEAPQQADRKQEVLFAGEDGALEKFAAALKASL